MFFIDFSFFQSFQFAFNSDAFDDFYWISLFFHHYCQSNIALQILEVKKNKKCVFHVLRNKNPWSSHEKSWTFLVFMSLVTRKSMFFKKWFIPNRLAELSRKSSQNTKFSLFWFFWSFLIVLNEIRMLGVFLILWFLKNLTLWSWKSAGFCQNPRSGPGH